MIRGGGEHLLLTQSKLSPVAFTRFMVLRLKTCTVFFDVVSFQLFMPLCTLINLMPKMYIRSLFFCSFYLGSRFCIRLELFMLGVSI